jgi:nucleoside recognition membrane protein YjiH
MSPELQIILLIIGVLAVGYLSVMPKIAGSSLKRLFWVDLGLMAFCLVLVGSKFSGLDIEFSLLFFKANWFVFTFVSYCVIESPLALWYMKKHGISPR